MNQLILFIALLANVPIVSPLNYDTASKPPDHQGQPAAPQHNSQPSVGTEEGQKPDIQPQQRPSQKEANVPINSGPNYTLWALILNGVLTLVTLGIAVAAVYQAIAAKDSAEIAMNAQRSWIISVGIDEPNFTNPWFQHIACHLKVIGSSPVRVTEANVRVRLVGAKVVNEKTDLRHPDLPERPDYKKPDTLENHPEMGRIRAPGEGFRVVPMLESLFLFEAGTDAVSGAQDVKAIRSRDKFLCAYGFVRYRDAFSRSKIRETRFCYVYHVRGVTEVKETEGFNVGGPPAYNEAT